eukprot:7578740-Pyramimonas_sp.AAC.1
MGPSGWGGVVWWVVNSDLTQWLTRAAIAARCTGSEGVSALHSVGSRRANVGAVDPVLQSLSRA